MSPCIFSCVLCGYIILNYENPYSTSWLKQFRILYTSEEGIAVTGVGIYNYPYDGEWIAPLDFNIRWDDPGYNASVNDQIGVLRQIPINGRYGFPFHESCWSLLDAAYSPQPIPYEALFHICRSLPSPSQGGCVNWGHDFGGLVQVDNQDYYPWEDRFIDRDEYTVPVEVEIARNDPFHIPEIQQLPLEKPEAPFNMSYTQPVSRIANCFTTLPQEICIEIASYLPTVDALSLRQVSQSFLPIFCSNQFWASRFRPYATDRSWLFESSEWDRASDWRWLYHRTTQAHRSKNAKNRERIWKLIQRLQGALSLQWRELSILPSSRPTPANLAWLEATGDLRQETRFSPYDGFHEGCRRLYEQLTPISELHQIGFSVIPLGDVQYITGMRLVPKIGEAIQLGYRTTDKEIIVDITILAGFNLAMSSRGIQGMQCIFDGGRTSQWIGCTYEAPKTKRLMASNSIAAVKAGFDGCKMVSLAIAQHNTPSAEDNLSLRDCAFWYPEIPRKELYLNEESFTARATSTTRYQPLCYTSFGGAKGLYLRHLTGISITIWSTICGMEFHYSSESVPASYRKLGRYKSSEWSKTTHFTIDGPGGEEVNAMTEYVRLFSDDVFWFYKPGQLQSLKISTNRGRSCQFGQIKSIQDTQIVEKPMQVATGTTITGFYWSQHESTLTALGIISEITDGSGTA